MAGEEPEKAEAPPVHLSIEGKEDIFDKEDFDATKFINQIYPDEQSLGDLDKFIDLLRKQIRGLDREIFNAVRTQTGAHNRARNDLGIAHSQIADLFEKMREIQRKAEESELMVQEICRDIKKLDFAKKHLTNAITALRRLAMLTNAITELEQVAYRRDQYRKCANLLEAVGQLMEFFDQYEQVPKVKSLIRRTQTVQAALQEAVMDDFKLMMGTADQTLTPDNLERLASACLVVNALGPKVRDQLMDRVCDREMGIYQAIFSSTGETAKLDRFERRYLWFKNRMDQKREQWAIFPESWRVPQTLALTFCKITKAHLKRVLDDQRDSIREDVATLIKCVVATNKFEKEMASTFGGGLLDEDEEGEEADADGLSASQARKRLEAVMRKMQQEKAAKKAAEAGEKAREAAVAAKRAFEGAISEAFEDALKAYVAEEERELSNHVAELIREEAERKWMPADDEVSSNVLGSANKLFLKIRGSLQRCVKLVSKGQTLLGLAGAFQHVLQLYAGELIKRLPKTEKGATTASPPFISTEWHIKVTEEDEKVVCHILNTAEYCRSTIEGLATAIMKDLKPGFADQIDFSEEESAFINVSTQSLSVLVLGTNTRLDVAVQEMLRIKWDAIEQPGDDSVFVSTARKVLYDCAPRLGRELDKANLSYVCDKMVRMFVPRYYDAIFKLKKMSEKGTLQLSIDTDAVRRILLDFPKACRPLDDDVAHDQASYIHYVEREFGAAINMVKVLQAKPENLVETFMLLMPATSKTVAEFTRVVDLKGLPAKQRQDLIAQFQKRIGHGQEGLPAALAAAATPSAPAAVMIPTISMPNAPNLGAFKVNMDHFAQNLSSGLSSFPKINLEMNGAPSLRDVTEAALAGASAVRDSTNITGVAKEIGGAFTKTGLSSVGTTLTSTMREGAAGLTSGLKDTAARTREGLLNFSKLMTGKNAHAHSQSADDLSQHNK